MEVRKRKICYVSIREKYFLTFWNLLAFFASPVLRINSQGLYWPESGFEKKRKITLIFATLRKMFHHAIENYVFFFFTKSFNSD